MRSVRDPKAGAPPALRSPRRRPWTIRLEQVRLDGVRAVEYGPLRLEGEGRASGTFRLVVGKELELDLKSLDMGGRLLVKGRPAAQNAALRTELRLGPYSPRQHRGAAALDFISGRLRLSEKALLAIDLKVEKGVLLPGSRADFAPPASDGSKMTITAQVTPGRRLQLAAGLQGFAFGGSGGGPPLVESDRLRVTAVSSEVRLSRLLAAGRSLRSGALPAAALEAELQAERLRVALDDLLLNGDLSVAGALSWSGGGLAIDRMSLAFSDGRLQSLGKTVASDLSLQSDARLASFAPGRMKGLEILRLVSGKTKVETSIESLGFLQPYLSKAKWLTLDGDGRLQADLSLDAGRLLPGSRFSVKPARLAAKYLMSRATGTGEMTGAVTRKEDGDELDIRVLFQQFQVAASEVPGARPHIQGQGLRMSLSTRELDLADPGKEIRARIDLPSADVRNISFYNAYLPPDSGLEIVSGNGRMSFWLEMSTASNSGKGETSLKSRAVVVRLDDLELAGTLDVDARLSAEDLRHRRFALHGTRLSLDGVTLRETGAEAETESSVPAGWWARLELPRATMNLAKPLSINGSVRLSMKDSGLLLALFAQRKRYLRWFSGLLTVEDIEATGDLRLGQGSLVLDPLLATGEQVELRTRLRLSRNRRRGCLFIRHGRQAVGIEIQGKQRDYRFVRPLKWFQTCGPP